MGIIILSFVIMLVFLVVAIIMRFRDEWSDWEIPICPAVFAFIIATIGTFIAWDANAYKDLTIEKYQMKYEMLTHQLNDDFYKTEFYDGRNKLMDDILNYNNDVINGRAKHKSIWIGCFYPEDWDSLPLIEFESEKGD